MLFVRVEGMPGHLVRFCGDRDGKTALQTSVWGATKYGPIQQLDFLAKVALSDFTATWRDSCFPCNGQAGIAFSVRPGSVMRRVTHERDPSPHAR